MLLEVKCQSCGSGEHIVKMENGLGAVLICKNVDCPDFNCFWELNGEYMGSKNVEIKKGLTGELEFENEDGKWYETYKNGEVVKTEKLS